MNEQLETILKNMAESRPVFHNEQDFQFEYAWQIKTKFPGWKIRFERPFEFEQKDGRIDLWLEGDVTYVIELKYPHRKITRGERCKINDEYFCLKDHGANDYAGYEFFRDVSRMEEVKTRHPKVRTFAIILTNMAALWDWKNRNEERYWDEFRMYDGRVIDNQICDWKGGKGNHGDKEEPITLKGRYEFHWQEYSEGWFDPSVDKNTIKWLPPEHGTPLPGGKFRYLFVEIS